MAVNIEKLIEKVCALSPEEQERVVSFVDSLEPVIKLQEDAKKQVVHIYSPRLKYPEQIDDFKMEVIKE